MSKTEWKARKLIIRFYWITSLDLRIPGLFNNTLVLARYTLCVIVPITFLQPKQGMYITFICITPNFTALINVALK